MKVNYIKQGDCISELKKMDDNSVDVSFTSPPYNRIRNDVYDHYDDTMLDYFSFLVNVTDEMLRVSKKQVIVNIQTNHFNKIDVYRYIGQYAKNIKGIVIWEKSNPQPGNNPRPDGTYSVTNAYEYFFIMGDNGREFRANGRVKNIITTSINSEHFKGHGAVMKKEVCDWFIEHFTTENDTVLDPFMGCGTTALSCINHNRNYIGYELVKEYCDIAESRIKGIENVS